MNPSTSREGTECPVCFKEFAIDIIEGHVIKCLDEASNIIQKNSNSNFGIFNKSAKKQKTEHVSSPKSSQPIQSAQPSSSTVNLTLNDDDDDFEIRKRKLSNWKTEKNSSLVPLAEKMRPCEFSDYVGQSKLVGEGSVLRNLLDKNVIPSMILWGSPGCGKTTLAHIISNYCNKHKDSMRFIKMSATTSGINDVKEVVKQAKSYLDKFKKQTILFMDEIHRFNKLQQVI